jgi:hypothetical protein
MDQPKPHPVACLELELAVLAIVEILVVLLCLLQSFSGLYKKFIPVLQLLLYCEQACFHLSCMPALRADRGRTPPGTATSSGTLDRLNCSRILPMGAIAPTGEADRR